MEVSVEFLGAGTVARGADGKNIEVWQKKMFFTTLEVGFVAGKAGDVVFV